MNKAHRYTHIEFPSYRFIPGENLIPSENPLWHFYGKKKIDAGHFAPDDWSKSEQYLFGIDLFNYAYWWEAHEFFESLWRIVPQGQASRDLLQGLIKISGAFLKWHSRNHDGLEYLYIGGIKHFLKVGEEHPVYMGLNVVEYIQRLQEHFEPVIEKYDWPDPLKNYPYVNLTLLEEKEAFSDISRAENEGFGMIHE